MFYSCSPEKKKAQGESFESGMWQAKLTLNDSLGVVLPFILELDAQGGYDWFIRNGEERIAIGSPDLEADSFRMDIPVFESELNLHRKGNKLVGNWIKYGSRKTPIEIVMEPSERFTRKKEAKTSLQGNYELHFSPGTADEYPAIGKFNSKGGMLKGTILTETGDYRYLVGIIDGNKFKLSTFDGAHAFLFTGDIIGDSLIGTFYSGTTWQEPFSGKLNNNFELKKATELTYLKKGYETIKFEALDLNGDEFKFPKDFPEGKPVLIQILGSWCPNCMDETRLLVEIKKNQPNLKIIGLAYERSLDSSVAFPNIRRMIRDLDVNYPVYLAGTWRKSDAAKTLPMLNTIISYPTLIMLNSQGKPTYIHTGFSGPGTGADYQKVKAEILANIKKLKYVGLNFLAIDFETATAAKNSTCEIGLTKVVDGKIVQSFSRLIKPRPARFHFFNTKIHGINLSMVENEPEFNEVWKELESDFEDQFLIAHNAAFDMGVIRSVLNQFNLPFPDCNYACSVQIAKKAWPDRTTHSLDQMANFLALKFDHHRAGDDSRVCAEIVLAAAEDAGAESIEHLLQIHGLQKKNLLDKVAPRKLKHSKMLKPEIYPDAKDHDFFRKEVVFTGKLESMSRRMAQEKVLQLGGFFTKSVTDQTSYLIAAQHGKEDQASLSSKTRYSLELIASGQNLKIISEAEFLEMLLDHQKEGLQLSSSLKN